MNEVEVGGGGRLMTINEISHWDRTEGWGIFNFQFSLPSSDFTLPPFMRWWSIEVYQCDVFFISHRGRRGRGDIFYEVVGR